MTNLARILDGRLREAINDPSRYTPRRNSAADHQVEPLGEWAARAAVSAIERAFLENDVTLITGKRLHELEDRGPTDARNDAGLLAFIVRDFMVAAGYRYDPGRPLTDQAHECGQSIRDTATYRIHFETRLALAERDHAAEVQRLTEAALEDDHAVAAWRAIAAPMPGPAEWNAVVYERDGLRKIVMDKDQELEDLQRNPNVACSPDGLIWIKNRDGWCIFTPNGEYSESEFGDELTDAQVADWPKGRLPDRPMPPAVLGDIVVLKYAGVTVEEATACLGFPAADFKAAIAYFDDLKTGYAPGVEQRIAELPEATGTFTDDVDGRSP